MEIIKNIAGILTGTNLGFPNVTAIDAIGKLLNIFYYITGAVAVIVIIIAGFYFVMGGNNPSTVAKAKGVILNTVIGLVIIIAAFAITNLITGNFK